MSSMFCVKVTPETSPLIQEMLFAKGWRWANDEDCDDGVQHIEKRYLFPWNDKFICYSDDNKNLQLELDYPQFIQWFQTDKLPNPTVKLNNNYTAVIYSNKVEVGCQTFSREASIKLAKTILKEMGED